MKIKVKCRILINGLFPTNEYKIDEFIQKTGVYDESIINMEHNDSMFYLPQYIIESLYSIKNERKCFYEFFENNKYIELEIEEKTCEDKEKLQEFVLSKFTKKIEMLQKRLRLITNISIGLPIFEVKIYNEKEEFITKSASTCSKTSYLNISEYTEEMKQMLCSRLKFYITQKAIEKIEETIKRYKRAMNFYSDSFNVADIGVRFTLLFSALESLFNISGDKVEETIAKYSSKILFLSSKKEKKMFYKIKDFYNRRSYYIHGNEPMEITEKTEFSLREIVRKVLLIYWYISQSEKIKDAEDMIGFLDDNNKDTIDIPLQIFIKMLDMKEYDELYNGIKSDLLSGKSNIL